jgi:CYTH domain-containing protein
MSLEIEKKFLVSEVPDNLVILKKYEIYQMYLATGTEEVRIRARFENGTPDYTLTTKSGEGLVRTEVCTLITGNTYMQLAEKSDKYGLAKYRTVIAYGDHELELDTYMNGDLNGLKVVEVEFKSVEEANAFTPPDWFGKDVTEDASYKNQSLWEDIQSAKGIRR